MQVKRIEKSEKSYFVSYAVGVNVSSEKGDETALIIPNENKEVGGVSFFILNGDWIDEYEKCESKEEQVQLFRDNYDEYSGFWTESLEDLNNLIKES